jgi:hypothetical protein
MTNSPSTLDPEKKLVLKAGDAQALLNYLSGQPCGQVYTLVVMLLNLQPVEEVAPTPETHPEG